MSLLTASLPPASLQPAAAPRSPRAKAAGAGSTVAQWKRQVTYFAVGMTVLLMAVAAGSAGAMWHVLQEVGRSERAGEAGAGAAVAARIAVVEVDRTLAQAIAEEDPAKARAAAVASISAATRLEDAVTQLRQVLPDNAQAARMARLVEAVKSPRVTVIVLARQGARSQALQALEAIGEPLRAIDSLSAVVLEAQRQERLRAAERRQALFTRLLTGLCLAAVASLLLAVLFYRRLMRRLARADQVEHLLEEVALSAGALDAGGRQLDSVNGEVAQANATLRVLLQRFESTSQAITQEAEHCLADLQALAGTCDASALQSREHAGQAQAVAERIHAAGAQMGVLMQSAQGLHRSCASISGFAEQIAGISATTRLLSLNAAVEAARAGSAGRSFGVIASAVRQLSEDTQVAAVHIRRASADIAGQLDATGQAVHATGALMDDCAGRITLLDASARSSRDVVGEMSRGVQGFRGSFERQLARVGALDTESQALVAALRDGQRHAQLLDATSSAMGQTSAKLLQRLSGLQGHPS